MKVNVERNVLGGFFVALGIPTVLGIHTCTATRDLPTSDQLVSYFPEAHYHIGQLYPLSLQLETILKTCNGGFMLSGFFITYIEGASRYYLTFYEMTDAKSLETGIARKHSVDFRKTLVSDGKEQSN
jgi:hypothetical protein